MVGVSFIIVVNFVPGDDTVIIIRKECNAGLRGYGTSTGLRRSSAKAVLSIFGYDLPHKYFIHSFPSFVTSGVIDDIRITAEKV